MESKLLPLLTWRSAICHSDLPPTSRHVALALSLWMNELGASAFPGTTRLVEATGLGDSTVRRDSRLLVERGWLEVVERGGVRGEHKRANHYAARIPVPLQEKTLSPRNPVTTEQGTPPPRSADPVTSWPPSLQELSIELSSPPNGQKKNPRATRVPIPFHVSDDMFAWLDENLPDVNAELETEKFVDFWRAKSGRDATKTDWPATWRNWMRNSLNYGNRK